MGNYRNTHVTGVFSWCQTIQKWLPISGTSCSYQQLDRLTMWLELVAVGCQRKWLLVKVEHVELSQD